MMRLDESLFEEVRIDPNFDEIEKSLMSVTGTGKVEFDYRPNDGVYKKPENHFIVLINEDTEALEEGSKEDFKLYFKNRREWKLGVVNKLRELGWKLEDPMEDNDSYLYLVVEKDTKGVGEGYELGSPFRDDVPGHKVEVYSDYHRALKRAKELGLKEAEYGDVFGTQISYCCWNKSGDRNEYEDVIAYYKFEKGKPISLSAEDREYIEREKDLTFDNPLRESLNESSDENSKLFADLFTQYLDSETPYQKINGAYDVEMYADYRDEISEKELTQILESDDKMEEFYDLLWHAYVDAEMEYRYDIEDGFKTWVKGTNSEINIDELDDWLLDYFHDYVDIHPDYEHFKSQGIKTILILDTDDANYDFTLNPSYANDYGTKGVEEDSSVYWLTKQQGHSIEELQKALDEEDTKTNSKFINSIVEECYNTSSSMNAITFLGKCTLGQLLDIDKDTSVVVNKSAVCGLVDTWAGGGSLLGIELEKDVVVPSNVIYYFGADGSNGGYSVDSIYGLTGSVWKDVFTIKSNTNATNKENVKENLIEKMWRNTVPEDLAKAFYNAVEKDSDDLVEIKDATLAICDWLESIDKDLEWQAQEIRDAWDMVDINDRYGYFDPDYDEDDYDEDESDFIDDSTNEDYVDEEIISVMYDILDANSIWMPLRHELSEKKLEDIHDGIDESFDSMCSKLSQLKNKKLRNKEIVESIGEIENAVSELRTKYFEE